LKIYGNVKLDKVISPDTTLFWFRRDLRLSDNAGLYHALKENKEVQPVFIFDSAILGKLESQEDARVEFIHQSLSLLKLELESLGSSLLVVYGKPLEFFAQIAPRTVYTNHDYEPYAIHRDQEVKNILEKKGSTLFTYKDQVIFEKGEILKDDGTPYTIFTPYSKKWKSKLSKFFLKSYPTQKYYAHFKKIKPLTLPSLEDIGFKKTGLKFPDRKIKLSVIEKYDAQRNFPAIDGTSRLSVHLRFGTVSIRQLAQIASRKNEVWLNELIWRDFYFMILWFFPHVESKSFKPSYDRIQWINNPDDFAKWCEGKTGYPIVDAGMRELNRTGFMHNRVRMIVASFLTKHLLIDWRWGEAYFASKLLDFDLSANNGGWQWAAGSGCDAAPYFRVFNPALQTDKFDPERKYIKKWVPEVDTSAYPPPMIDHSFARERVLAAYKKALS
jgi:deoxyribodipyrimidine photo-lyase